MPFKDTLRTAALANTALAALIGSQWFDTQLPQTVTLPLPGSLGAIVAQQITGPRLYSLNARIAKYWARYQFTVWGGQFSQGAELRDSIVAALASFLDQTSFDGIAGRTQNPNYIVGDRDALFPQTDGPIYQRIIDAMLMVNEATS